MELNSDWIKDYEKIGNEYDIFYKVPVKKCTIFFLYINRFKELFHIKKRIIDINNGILDKRKLIYYLITHHKHNGNSYKPVSILKYNFSLDIADIDFFLKNKLDANFTLEKSIKDIKWENTPKPFSSMNSLYVLFFEKVRPNNITKRVYISKKKTRRKL